MDILWNFEQCTFPIWKIKENDREKAVNNLTIAKFLPLLKILAPVGNANVEV